jgi:hypothetical protein
MGDMNPGFDAQPRQKPTGFSGREDGQDGAGAPSADGAVSSHHTPRKAGVVIRASVEHTGLVGDTELTVSVKWPASTFCVPPCPKPVAQPSPGQDVQQVPGNGPLADIGTLYGPSLDDARIAIAKIQTGEQNTDVANEGG